MGLLHYCTFRLEAANDAQNVSGLIDRARWKDNDQQSISKLIIWYRSNEITSAV